MKRPRRRSVLVVALNVTQVMLIVVWIGVHTEAARASAQPAWGWPLAGESTVERPFTPPTTAWGAGHRGVDLLAQPGETVVAAGEGVVTYAGLLAGRGVVTVSHASGLRTTYEPVTASVRVGASIAQGDPVGSLGTGHDSCRLGTTCLHWGLLRGQTYLDPLSVVTQGRLRLLPTGAGVTGSGAAAVQVTVGRVTSPAVGSPSPAVAEPRRRMTTMFVNAAANVAGAAAIAYGLFLLGRKTVRLVRRVRG